MSNQQKESKMRTDVLTVDGRQYMYQGRELHDEIRTATHRGHAWAMIDLPNQQMSIAIAHIVSYKLVRQ